MLMWFPSNRLYKSVCCIFSLLSSHFPQSCTVLLFALITVSPLLQAAIILSPEKLEELRKKSSVMTVFSFKFRLAVSLEALNNNKEWKKQKSQQITFSLNLSVVYGTFSTCQYLCGWSRKYLTIHTVILPYTTFSIGGILCVLEFIHIDFLTLSPEHEEHKMSYYLYQRREMYLLLLFLNYQY